VPAYAQDNGKSEKKKKKPISAYKYDTTYMYKYHAALTLGPTLSYKNFNLIILPQKAVDTIYVSKIRWRSPSDRYWGIDFNYDKLGFTLSIASFAPKVNQDKKGRSSGGSFAFNYGGNRCFVEVGVTAFKGFYEANSALEDTTLDTYYQSKNMSAVNVNMKTWYLTNFRKFAFKSSYGGVYRQLKTQASVAFCGNLHVNDITTDSSIVPDQDKHYFDNALQVRDISAAGVSFMGGGAVNFILWKNYFVNMAWVLGPDLQAMSIVTEDSVFKRAYVSFAQDFRLATGFNARRWYLTFTWKHETNRFINDFIETRIRLNSFSLNMGWRFNVKAPRFYKNFQNTRFYGLL
jgi:hypothetical protein